MENNTLVHAQHQRFPPALKGKRYAAKTPGKPSGTGIFLSTSPFIMSLLQLFKN